MPHIFALSASAANEGSRSRLALEHAIAAYRAQGWTIDLVDLVQTPPPYADGAFIDASFTRPANRTDSMHEALAYSDAMVERIDRADRILIATPMYNFGMPAQLKGWFDQIIRPGLTFGTTDDPQAPYVGLLADRPTLVLTTRGSTAFAADGALASLNLLDPHVGALLSFIGLDDQRLFDLAGTDEPDFDLDAHLATLTSELTLPIAA